MEVSGQLHISASLLPNGESPVPVRNYIGGWVGSRAIFDVEIKRKIHIEDRNVSIRVID